MPLSSALKPGKMRQRIVIAQPSGHQDSFGGVTEALTDWTQVLSCWASIEANSGRDQQAVSQYVMVTSHKITIRNPRAVAITNAMVVWFGNRTFQIAAVLNPDERNKTLILMCLEINRSTEELQRSP